LLHSTRPHHLFHNPHLTPSKSRYTLSSTKGYPCSDHSAKSASLLFPSQNLRLTLHYRWVLTKKRIYWRALIF